MIESTPPPPALLLADDEYLAFPAVPQLRHRHNGWTPPQQARFILALQAMGSVSAAVKAVGMSRKSAYELLGRPGAEGFARSWERALESGRQRMFDVAMERAINGVTTIHVQRGGSVSIKGGADMRLVQAALRGAGHPIRGHR
ncbi:hypothetical protein DXH95_08110 [Sphingorhabdus pulchriflava]|uniref:Uncharacterized protein n=1 Tax=Sphingorhabdus pulchriflava TaxID=2292257 RepID=A0A371BIU2_9SPHN|nr:hypothetical protein [Sphingorhabdus pulchriflava]MBK7161014.1 hypothetical protein [Sphingomonadales bacterium]RDV07313.1 hypothetical protein DXH95_08110 [Sphingorhabdus pulchriflava]